MSKPVILIVEDDPISARLSSNLLAELEAEIIVVHKGEDAIAHFNDEKPVDIVLMDLYLPGLNGFDSAAGIRETEHYRTRRVPIIALTSNALMERKEDFLKKTGFTDYITKPPRKDTFAGLVKKHLPPPPTHKLSWY
jgi:CheY-like chemotaxis protein